MLTRKRSIVFYMFLQGTAKTEKGTILYLQQQN